MASPPTPDRVPRWLPWAAVAAMAWLVLFPITSVDAYYHLAVGRHILEHRAIPDRAVFSATFGDRPWHDNEWGFQVVAAGLGRAERAVDGTLQLTPVGLALLIGLRAATLAATLALLSAAMGRVGVDRLTRSIAVVWIAFLTFNNLFWTIRPQILTYLALACLVWLVSRDRTGDRFAAWWAPVVIALWANVHGAFIIGIVLIGIEAVGSWLDRDGRTRRWIAVAALSPLAACLNPHGWNQLWHPFLYVLRPEIHAGNAEWTRPDFVRLPLFALTVALTVVVLAARSDRRWADVLRFAAFVALLATAIRHLPLAAIVTVPILAESAARASERGGWRAHLLPTSPAWGGAGLRAFAAVGLAATVIALSGARFVGPVPAIAERPIRPMPEDGVRRIVQDDLAGTVFNSYRMGGFLMFRLYPQERLFMDGRNDVYGTFRDEVYNPILRAEPGWRDAWAEVVERFDVGCALLDDDAPLAGALSDVEGWTRRATRDRGTVLWVRDASLGRETGATP